MTKTKIINGGLIFCVILSGSLAHAQGDDAAIAMAKKAQDPLGDVRALMTDNTIAFDGGPNDDTTYGFVFQPVYAIANESRFKWNRWRSPLSNQNRYVRPSDHIKTVSVSGMS